MIKVKKHLLVHYRNDNTYSLVLRDEEGSFNLSIPRVVAKVWAKTCLFDVIEEEHAYGAYPWDAVDYLTVSLASKSDPTYGQGMQKYGVVTDPEEASETETSRGEKTGTYSTTCPECGSEVTVEDPPLRTGSGSRVCPNCGTKPFER
jgi:hypothetical protein